MDPFLAALGQSWPALAFLVAFAFLVLRRRQQRHSDAFARGLGRTGRGAPPSPALDDGEIPGRVGQGTHQCSGHTRGVEWHAEVTLLMPEVDDDQANRRRTNLQTTRWTAPTVTPGAGAMLLMSLPEGTRVDAPSQAPLGVLETMAAQAARVATQAYLRLYFGHARSHRSLLGPEHRLDLAGDALGRSYAAFADPPELADRFTTAARDHLQRGHGGCPALLWDEDGLTLAWPHAFASPAEMAAVVDFGATLVSLLATSNSKGASS